MLVDLKRQYRTVLVKISQDLTEEERIELLFYSKEHIPRSFSGILSAGVQIFDRLEDAQVISSEKLDFLTDFARTVKRQDLVTELTAFELTRELVFYALKRRGLESSVISSTASVGLHLAEMVNIVPDRVDVPAQGLIKSLLESQQKACDLFDVIYRKALPDADETKLNDLALLVAIAAEIVLLVFDEDQRQDNGQKYALDVAIELAKHPSFKVANWKDFCRFVRERRNGHFRRPVDEPAPDLSWQLVLTDLVGKMKEAFFRY